MTATTDAEAETATTMPGMRIVSQQEWFQVYLDTPIMNPGSQATAQGRKPPDEAEAMLTPGCCVKSVERESPQGWPKHHGRLQSYDRGADRLVVASHSTKIPTDPWFIWEGTAAEYCRLWDCD